MAPVFDPGTYANDAEEREIEVSVASVETDDRRVLATQIIGGQDPHRTEGVGASLSRQR